MMQEHEAEFAEFADVHANYAQDQTKWQAEFNRVGKPITQILHDWEKRLCGHTEKGHYAQFSSKLADKFQAEVKAFFPLIDFVGVKVSGPALNLQETNTEKDEQPPATKPDPDIAEVENINEDLFDIPKLY